MTFHNSFLVAGALSVASLTIVGCATKKHVREAIAPVQNQLNQTQSQVATLQNEVKKQGEFIGDLDRQVSVADEKATDAGKKATQAAEAATQASNTAMEASKHAATASEQATAANTAAQQALTSLQNLDNYKLIDTEQVYFGFNQSTLNTKDQAKLDTAIQTIGSTREYVVEIEGFADSAGSKTYNRELSRKRADAVVHYLVVEHNVPLRSIRILGAGSDFPGADNKTSISRKENRRVDVKMYSLDLAAGQATAEASRNSIPSQP